MSVIFPIILVCICAGLYLLYINGYIPVQSKRALVFIGSAWGSRNQSGASFQSATGTIQRVIRYKESKSVTFSFTGDITDGDVEAFVLDRNKQVLLTLHSGCSTGKLWMESKQRYYLKIRFQHASGAYRIKWD